MGKRWEKDGKNQPKFSFYLKFQREVCIILVPSLFFCFVALLLFCFLKCQRLMRMTKLMAAPILLTRETWEWESAVPPFLTRLANWRKNLEHPVNFPTILHRFWVFILRNQPRIQGGGVDGQKHTTRRIITDTRTHAHAYTKVHKYALSLPLSWTHIYTY